MLFDPPLDGPLMNKASSNRRRPLGGQLKTVHDVSSTLRSRHRWDALPERLSVHEMAAAAGVSLWSLQRAFERAYHTTPVAHVQHLCLEFSRRDIEAGAPGATVFASPGAGAL
jgi:AraC-like DNA-binding protein